MYILGLDTTQAACSAAVFNTDTKQICGRVYVDMQRGHAEALPEIISDTLAMAELSFSDITKLATSVGPGTFTGVRVGLSAARGFALALELPLVGITSLEAIAAGVEGFHEKKILAAFDARRDEVYAQLFINGKADQPPQLLNVQQAAQLGGENQTEVVGTASTLLVGQNKALVNSKASGLPDAGIVAMLASQRECNGVVQPLYLRKADAKAQKPLLSIERSALELKKATAAHCEIFAHIHAQGFSNPWPSASIKETLSSPGVRALLATDKQNDPLGFIIVRDIGNESEILTLAVRLDARRRQIASFLLNALLGGTKSKVEKKVFLEVSENNFAAQNLYNKFGFLVCGRRKKYYTENDGQKYDAIVMEKVL